MASRSITLLCPECGAKINIEETKVKAFCTYCGAKIFDHSINEEPLPDNAAISGKSNADRKNNDNILRDKQWKAVRIKRMVAFNEYHTVCAKLDGTVCFTRLKGSKAEETMSKWIDIVAVAADKERIIGLRSNGVKISVDIYSGTRSTIDSNVFTMSKTGVSVNKNTDGTRTAHIMPVEAGKNIVMALEGKDFRSALKKDGTVFTCKQPFPHIYFDEFDPDEDEDYGKVIPNTAKWRYIVSIDAGPNHIVGVKVDGTVVASGSNEKGQCDVSAWSDIVSVAAGDVHTVGVTAQGNVIATGSNQYGQCNVAEWNHIVAVVANGYSTIGITADGRLLYTGKEVAYQHPNVDWKLFESIDTLEKELKNAVELRREIVYNRGILDTSQHEAEIQDLEQRRAVAERRKHELQLQRGKCWVSKKKKQELLEEITHCSFESQKCYNRIIEIRNNINHNWEE